MEEYRICKNKYGWFKLQLWCPPRKILRINLKGKWRDTCFHLRSRKCRLFKTFSEAEKAKGRMIQNSEKLNNEWKSCESN